MGPVSMPIGDMHSNTCLVLEFLNHNTETLGSRSDFGVVEPTLDVHGNSLSIF